MSELGVGSKKSKIYLDDLIAAGVLTAGMPLYPRRKPGVTATLLPDGRIDLNGHICDSPSEAAVALAGRPTNGWSYFRVDPEGKLSLRKVRRDYMDQLADAEDDDDDDDGDDGV